MKRSRNASLTACRAGPLVPEGTYSDATEKPPPKSMRTKRPSASYSSMPRPRTMRVGLAPRIDRDAAVAFFLRVDEGGVELGPVERLGRELMFLRLRFLQAHDVGLLLVHPAEEALARGGPDAVEVAGDDAEHDRESFPVKPLDHSRATGPNVVVTPVPGHSVQLTNLDKVYFRRGRLHQGRSACSTTPTSRRCSCRISPAARWCSSAIPAASPAISST